MNERINTPLGAEVILAAPPDHMDQEGAMLYLKVPSDGRHAEVYLARQNLYSLMWAIQEYLDD